MWKCAAKLKGSPIPNTRSTSKCMSKENSENPTPQPSTPGFDSSSQRKIRPFLGPIRRRTFLFAGLGVAANFLGCGGAATVGNRSSSNPIVEENMKTGDPSWKLANAATNHEIEGFASATSANRGETISFFVNTPDSAYTLAIYRMGWYGGVGARLVSPAVTLGGIQQPLPTPAANTNLVECNWQSNHQVTVSNSSDPTDWASGFYLAKLIAQTSGKEAYIVFVVRDDGRSSDLLFNSSVNTYQAYNLWGGYSLYTNPPAYEVSFNRPYANLYGAQDFLEFEINMVRFLEREGYDVTYCTDVDVHENGSNLIPAHKGFFLAGHGEYWTWQMRDNVEGARDKSTNLAFFGSNTSYWQIRYAPSSITGYSDRTIICYKYEAMKLDPYAIDGNPNNDYLLTTQFRLPPVNRPEDQMCGAMYNEPIGAGPVSADIIVTDASSWVFQGTNVQNGTHLAGLLGSEVDQMFANVPPGVASIAHSPYTDRANGQTLYADMTVYSASSGTTVFDAGTKWWNWGLDSYTPGTHPDLTNASLQQATRNVLKKFGAVPGTP